MSMEAKFDGIIFFRLESQCMLECIEAVFAAIYRSKD